MHCEAAGAGARGLLAYGYLQSWRYFDAYRDAVLAQFTFAPAVLERAAGLVRAIRRNAARRYSVFSRAGYLSRARERALLAPAEGASDAHEMNASAAVGEHEVLIFSLCSYLLQYKFNIVLIF